MIELTQLAIYPIKSTAQISLPRAQISSFGLKMDRRWMLIDGNAQMLTQRKHATLCLIKTAIQPNFLCVTAPGMPVLSVPLCTNNTPSFPAVQATVWDDTCNALDCGQQAADWFSAFLKISARLVFFPDSGTRQIDLNFANQGDNTAFSDGFPYLLIGQSSLDDLNHRLCNHSTPVSMRRFRPNLVVGKTDAYAEDHWKRIRIGNIDFSLVKPCSRCSIPGIHPQTAEKSAEPLKTLANYRMRESKIFFGQNMTAQKVDPQGSTVLEVGMAVEVLEQL